MQIKKENIGKFIKETRISKHLTQEQLAKRVDKKRSYISRIETKEGSNIKLHTFLEIIEKGFEGKINIELN